MNAHDIMDEVFALDYWKVTQALSRAFDADWNSDGFWQVCVELTKVYPQFDWINAMTDEGAPL